MELKDTIEAYDGASPEEQREFREILEPVPGDIGKQTCA